MPMNDFWAHWYFHIPNYALALAAYLILGRLVLSAFLVPESPNFIWRFFVRLTNPLINGISFITPRVVPLPAILVFAFFWLLLLRFGLYIALAALTAASAPS